MMNMQQAGLGAALGAPQKQGQDLSGMMAMMNMLKDVPDQTLADVLAGKPVHLDIEGTPTQVPQFAAMLAAQGRQQLRTAMAGQQAQQPSIKDQLLAAEQQAANPQQMIVPPQQGMAPPQQAAQPEAPAGLDQIPAPNMQQMAGGGITEDDVPSYAGTKNGSLVQQPDYLDYYKQEAAANNQKPTEIYPGYERDKNLFGNIGEFLSDIPKKLTPLGYTDSLKKIQDWGQTPVDEQAKRFRSESSRTAQAVNPDKYVPPPTGVTGSWDTDSKKVSSSKSSTTGSWDETPAENKKKETKTDQTEGGLDNILKAKKAAGPSVPASNAGPKIISLEDTQKMLQADPMYQSINNTISELKDKPNRFQAMLDEQAKQEPERKKEIEDTRNQGIGQYMMQMGAALVANPQFGKAIQEGNTAGLAALNMSRKEIKELQKDYRDYNLSIQKGAEASEQGNRELAQRYQTSAIQLQTAMGENVYRANQSNIAAYKAPFENSVNAAHANYYNVMPGIMAEKNTNSGVKMSQITIQQAITDFNKATSDPKEKRLLIQNGITTPLLYQQAINNGTFGQPSFNVVQKPTSGRILE
jgi:hypothetical protein